MCHYLTETLIHCSARCSALEYRHEIHRIILGRLDPRGGKAGSGEGRLGTEEGGGAVDPDIWGGGGGGTRGGDAGGSS